MYILRILRVLSGLLILSLIRNLILKLNCNSLSVATKYYTTGRLLSRPFSPVSLAFNCKRTMSAKPSFKVPVITYTNPDKEKELIVNGNKGRTGIYRWVHIESGKSYIGSSVKLNIRFKQYFNYNHISYPKRNMMIYKALLKYGYAGFRLEILEYCSPEVLPVKLQYYIDSFKPEYNISAVPGQKVTGPKVTGVKIHKKYFHSGNPHCIIPTMSYIDALAEKKAILQDNKDKSGGACA